MLPRYRRLHVHGRHRTSGSASWWRSWNRASAVFVCQYRPAIAVLLDSPLRCLGGLHARVWPELALLLALRRCISDLTQTPSFACLSIGLKWLAKHGALNWRLVWGRYFCERRWVATVGRGLERLVQDLDEVAREEPNGSRVSS